MCSTWTYNLFIPCVRHKYIIMLALCFSTNTQSIHTMCFTLNSELIHSMYLSWTHSSFYTMCLIWITQFISIMCSFWPHSLTIIFCVYIKHSLSIQCVHIQTTQFPYHVLTLNTQFMVSMSCVPFEHSMYL